MSTSSSSSSSEGTDSSGSASSAARDGTSTLPLDAQDDAGDSESSTESDSGWSDTSGKSDELLYRDQIWGSGAGVGDTASESKSIDTSTGTPSEADHDVKTDIIEKIIQTRRRSFEIQNEIEGGGEDAQQKRRRRRSNQSHHEIEGGGEDAEEPGGWDAGPMHSPGGRQGIVPFPPGPPPPPSPLHPSPKSVMQFKDFSPKKPMRCVESDDDDGSGDDSSDDGKDEQPSASRSSDPKQRFPTNEPRLDRPPPPPLFVETKYDDPVSCGPGRSSQEPDFSFRDEWTNSEEPKGDLEQDSPDLEDSLKNNLVEDRGDRRSQTGRYLALVVALCFCLLLGAALGVITVTYVLPELTKDDNGEDSSSPIPSSEYALVPSLSPALEPTATTPTKSTLEPTATESPTITRMQGLSDIPHTPILDVLSAASSDKGAAIRLYGSPQQQAYLWLLENNNNDDEATRLGGMRRRAAETAPVDVYGTNVKLRKVIQRYAMATIWYSTNGPSAWRETDGWMNASLDECFWMHADVDDTSSNGRNAATKTATVVSVCDSAASDDDGDKWLSSLEFHDNSLSGRLPPELGLLSNLRHLVIKEWRDEAGDDDSDRQLSGALPSEIGTLTHLETLILNGHDFGLLPLELGNLDSLQVLDLGDNRLTGPLPTLFGSMDHLQRLDLGRNSFQETIPIEWAQLTRLEWLDLSHNKLTGTVPIPVLEGVANTIQGLDLSHNDFEGVLASELGLLSNIVDGLHLDNNAFEGELPTELAFLSNLTSFKVNDNNLSGTIPESFQQWTALHSFQIHGNNFDGAVPEGLCQVLDRHRQDSPWTTTSSADCPLEISCSCCEFCCTDEQGCKLNTDLLNATSSDRGDISLALFRESFIPVDLDP